MCAIDCRTDRVLEDGRDIRDEGHWRSVYPFPDALGGDASKGVLLFRLRTTYVPVAILLASGMRILAFVAVGEISFLGRGRNHLGRFALLFLNNYQYY
jgi:hypothetical protein